jgi:cysteine-rich repeat protein
MPCEVNLNNRCQPLRCENGAQCKVINGQSTCHYCGNGVVDVSEQCDDGNSVNTDRCSNTCKAARCGDGVKQPGEQCDDGNRRSNDSCTNTCALPRCGDGIKQNREECDDGNRNNGDRCSNRCRRNR